MSLRTALTWPDELHAVDVVDRITQWAFNILPNANTNGAAASLIVTTRRCLLFGFTASSTLGSGQFIQLYDAQGLPGSGASPLWSYPISATSGLAVHFVPPRFFRNGCVIVNSTAQNTYTAGAANTIIDAQYL